MFNSRSSLSLFVAFFFFIGLVSAAPVPPKGHAAAPAKGHAAAPTKGHAAGSAKAVCPTNLRPRANKVFLGYNGFNGTPRNPQASAGGELGAVFYIADAADLAKSFARGGDSSKDYVCLVYADAEAWASQPKVWVPATAHRGNGMNTQYPGAVLFDNHTPAGLPAGSPAVVNQMGIRQAQITRLGVTAECHPKSCFADEHHTLNYGSLKANWHIQ